MPDVVHDYLSVEQRCVQRRIIISERVDDFVKQLHSAPLRCMLVTASWSACQRLPTCAVIERPLDGTWSTDSS